MNVLVIGSGGREHALAWKLAHSNRVNQVFVAPGNAGTAREKKTINVTLDTMDLSGLALFAKAEHIDLTVVGPEAPLVAGLVDHFRSEGLSILGPTAAAAQLEGSKAFAKSFMQQHTIPTARSQTFHAIEPAINYIQQMETPLVIKADGLASGKGVIIAHTQQEAMDAATTMLVDKKYAQAGQRIIIEEFLSGEEISFIVLADGETALPLATSQDHKTLYDGDTGPNTGGMGAYSPAPLVSAAMHRTIIETIITPTITGMRAAGEPYTGFLFVGLMIKEQQPYVLEYNCRLGDPETQALLMRLQSDFFSLCLASVQGNLHEYTTRWDPRIALGVVMVNSGYPNQYSVGALIDGLDPIQLNTNQQLFHAGTALDTQGRLITNGGRVLCAVALENKAIEAKQAAYELVRKIQWDGVYYRKDIGDKAICKTV